MAKTFSFAHAVVRSLIPKLSKKFTVRESALDFLKSEGMGIRKTDFLRYWNEITGSIAKGERIKYVRKDRKPSADLIGFTEHNISNKFQIIAEVDSTDQLTGLRSTSKVSFVTGVMKDIGDMEETLWMAAEGELDDSGASRVHDLVITEIRSSDKRYETH